MWVAVTFRPSGSEDPAKVLGVFSTKDLAVDRVKRDVETDDEMVSDDHDTFVDVGVRTRRGRFDVLGQAIYMPVDRDFNVDL
jgi:hypothetical protein